MLPAILSNKKKILFLFKISYRHYSIESTIQKYLNLLKIWALKIRMKGIVSDEELIQVILAVSVEITWHTCLMIVQI